MSLLLPNGCQIEQINPNETRFLVDEIFTRQVYPLPDLSGREQPVIIDLGANIGVFALYALHSFPGARLVCVEPAPPVADVLERNLAGKAEVVRCAVGSVEGELDLTYYPGYSNMSRLNGDRMVDKALLGTSVRDFMARRIKRPGALSEHHVASVVDEMLGEEKAYRCPVVTLGSLLESRAITTVDYLKMDVEGAEFGILRSLADECWAMIRAIGLEVHEHNQDADTIKAVEVLLAAKGFLTSVAHVLGETTPRTAMVYGARL